ncbi:MAG: S8 family serine peptidase [Bdellovibrionaceae bacterium]|nr:S8 family serine peptidase [Pseudobdellovibrionaceae bacterium]
MKSLIFAAVFFPVWAMAALVDPRLQNFAAAPTGKVRVLALMDLRTSRPLPVRASTQSLRHYLNDEMQIAWKRVEPSLATEMSRGEIGNLKFYAINLSFTADVTPQGLRALARAPGVSKVYADAPVTMAQPVRVRSVAGVRNQMPYDLLAMKLDELWKTNPELIGTGVLVGHIDTGVDGRHGALAGKISLFYDAGKSRTSDPYDADTHGTHTAGTVAGAGVGGAPMGVAPGARLISAAALTGYDDMLKSMSFMLNPDGKVDSSLKPRLVTNSWNCQGAPDVELFYRAISAWEAGGILTVFSAGNSGPRPRSITKPHEHPLSFSVAATGPNGRIADFSSRGPGVFNGQDTQKPDLGAPGVDIISAVPGGGYKAMSGTSMAAPHIAGLAAILYQVDPSLTPAKIREVMLRATDSVDEKGQPQGEPRWNPVFGFGHANALKAVSIVKAQMGARERRWGQFMAPAVDLIKGFQAMTDLGTNFESDGDPSEVFQTFVTDESQWLQGELI